MSNNNATKKFSRRKAGNYGRPGSKAQKRTASKSARRFNAISVEDAFRRDSNENAQRTFAERKGIDRTPSPTTEEIALMQGSKKQLAEIAYYDEHGVHPPEVQKEIEEAEAEYERLYVESGQCDRDVEMLIEREREERVGSGSEYDWDMQMNDGGRA